MSTNIGGNLPATQAVPEWTRALWDELKVQITPFNSVICIDGWVFLSLTDADKSWISAQYRALVNVHVQYVSDNDAFRVFLARADQFPPGSLSRLSDSMGLLVNPHLLAGPLPSAVFEHDRSLQLRQDVKGHDGKSRKVLRPANAFILYRKAHHEAVKAAHPGIHNNEISVILGNQWQQEDAGVIAQYKLKAALLKEEHMRQYPDYQYQPRKASEVKRRMTKKKAAAQSQDEAPSVDDFGVGNNPSDHDFSEIGGNWQTNDLTSIEPGCDTAAVLNHIQLHNEQQGFTSHLERDDNEVIVIDNSSLDVMAAFPQYVNRDAFDEFIDARMLADILS